MFDILTTTPAQEAKALLMALQIAENKAKYAWGEEIGFLPEWAGRETFGTMDDTYYGLYRDNFISKMKSKYFLETIEIMGITEKGILRRASKEYQQQYADGLISLVELSNLIIS